MDDSLHTAEQHCRSLRNALVRLRGGDLARITGWGRHLASHLMAGGRLLTAGNGGSAAQAQHLTAELVGRYRGERPAYSALALHADTSSVTAVGNDYGFELLYARQVAAHGRPGDILLSLSTSGRSRNLLAAVAPARAAGLHLWAMTGPTPNPLAGRVDDAVCVAAEEAATVQEAHLVAVHLLCEAFDTAVAAAGHPAPAGRTTSVGRSTPAGHPAVVDGVATPTGPTTVAPLSHEEPRLSREESR